MTVTAQLSVEEECVSVLEQDVTGDSVRTGQGLRTGKIKGVGLNRNGHNKQQRRSMALMNDMGIVNLVCY